MRVRVPLSAIFIFIYVTMAQLESNELKNGTVFEHMGRSYVVLRYEHVTQGRGGATIKVKVKDLLSGAIMEKSFRGNEKVTAAYVTKKSAQYLYSDSGSSFFMDAQDFTEISLPRDENVINYLKEGEKAIIVYKDETPIAIELPNTVDLTVTYTEPGYKGNTATNAMKRATLETGKEVDVPMFINTGEMIKISTETGNYLSRA